MPLLNKKPFRPIVPPEDLRDDEEIFHCVATNEIFRDYEQFSERMFLCNSMVWTCSLTRKSNLTYAEALESEEKAKSSVEDFPLELKVPLLFLASKTKRIHFGDLVEDVFVYAKDRYFKGENVEGCSGSSKWKESQILHILETKPEIKTPEKNGNLKHQKTSYKYEVKYLGKNDENILEIVILESNQIRRKKGTFSRDKCKFLLKLNTEKDSNGIFVVNPKISETLNLHNVTFDNIFVGTPPQFEESKKAAVHPVNGKKMRQESMHKFLSKTNNTVNNINNNIIPNVKKDVVSIEMKKEQERQTRIEMRNWYIPKEDLELPDHQALVQPTPVKMSLPDENLGDILMVLEFVNNFSEFLSVEDYFPNGFTLEVIEDALTHNQVAGSFVELIQMFLNALFCAQAEESSQYRNDAAEFSQLREDEYPGDVVLREATRRATVAAFWSNRFQGVPLNKLPLYSVTTSEILRLHLLSSGAMIRSYGAKWRYCQRGGFVNSDDPGLHLRLEEPEILNALKTKNVVELSITDKLKILSCLINQLLTYADVRDIVEGRVKKMRKARTKCKKLLTEEKKRHMELTSMICKLRKELKADPRNETIATNLQKLLKQDKDEQESVTGTTEKLMKVSYENQIIMGYDRSFRQYLKLESVPGLYISDEVENRGFCFNSIIDYNPKLVNISRNEVSNYIKNRLHIFNPNNKENNKINSPKKLTSTSDIPNEEKFKICEELQLCSANPATCVVHSSSNRTENWHFFPNVEHIDQLIGSLNKRGIRESELQNSLKYSKEKIESLIVKTPGHLLNPDKINPVEPEKPKWVCEDPNLGYSNNMSPEEVLHSALVKNILDMEAKLNFRSLGSLPVKNREAWRACLQNRTYKHLDRTLVNTQDEKLSKNTTKVLKEVYQPLDSVTVCNGDKEKSDSREAIKALAIALAQVARAVDENAIKRPLGSKKFKKIVKMNLLPLWERSLLLSTSFSQLFLHYTTLDSCIMWKKALCPQCHICKHSNDIENILFCSKCDHGYHLYCLTPKLESAPDGAWSCEKCNKCRRSKRSQGELRKIRTIFTDDEEDLPEGEESEEFEEDDVKTNGHSEDDDTHVMKVELCKVCGSGGEVIYCEKCSNCFHIECVDPPLRRAPRGAWSCMPCKIRSGERRRTYYLHNGAMLQRTGKVNGRRRCAAQALFKIHDFAKSLRNLSDTDDSSDEEVLSKRNTRQDDTRSELPLHNSALHAVLTDVMKDANAWPFLRPVQKTEVPDYHDVITKPMDFGTIKYKLNMGEYKEDMDFMYDALLIFQNCNTYNHTDDDVYKCGTAILKLFQEKCKELGLKLPEELDDVPQPRKKIRTK